MAKKTASLPPESPASRRYVYVAAGVLVVVVALLLVLWPRFRTQRLIADLHSNNAVTVNTAREQLLASDDEGLNDVLVATLRDVDTSFPVRVAVGQILLRRNRLPQVEAVLQDADPRARQAALAVLFGQVHQHGMDWFKRSYVEPDPEAMRETIRTWLAQDRDASRSHAVELASALAMKDAVPAIRELVRPSEEVGSTRAHHRLIEAAAKALLAFEDCEGVKRFAAAAKQEQEDVVRLRMMQALYRGVRGPQPPCPDAVSEQEVKDIVIAALDGPANTRHGAILLLRGEPAWAKTAMGELQAVLDEDSEGDFARRAALGALAETGDLEFARRLPRYFHDADQYVRSEAVTASRLYAALPEAPVRYVSCWIGVLENETENEFAVYGAMGGLRDAAGQWLGLSQDLVRAAAKGEPAWITFRKTLFEQGEASGLSRSAWARMWFDWWAIDLGLEGEAIDRAWALRRAFWLAARSGDLESAKTALDGIQGLGAEGLDCYERAWLDRSSG